jgi:hypothetical protein
MLCGCSQTTGRLAVGYSHGLAATMLYLGALGVLIGAAGVRAVFLVTLPARTWILALGCVIVLGTLIRIATLPVMLTG